VTAASGTIVELLGEIPPGRALCAVNVENFDTLAPAQARVPIIIALSVPAARYFGFEFAAELVGVVARRCGVRYALHLDHCEDPNDLREAVAAGFTSANYLDEGHVGLDEYNETATALRREFGGRVSLEFILGTLGHAATSTHEGHGDTPSGADTIPPLDAIVEFANRTQPDILGFPCGSLHGMPNRTRSLDVPLSPRRPAGRSSCTGRPGSEVTRFWPGCGPAFARLMSRLRLDLHLSMHYAAPWMRVAPPPTSPDS
jgi:hypothetical protein